jgi:hypothetical protein
VSFDPRLPESMRLFTKRVMRDEAVIAQLEKDVEQFLAELNVTVKDLLAKYEQKEAA